MFKGLIVIALLVGCSQKLGKVEFGKTTSKKLLETKGEPVEIKKIESEPKKEASTYIYENNEKFQVENDIVTTHFRTPVGRERKLIYWKHKFKHLASQFKELKQQNKKEEGFHPNHEIQLDLKEEGLSLIYHSQKDEVIRIVEYQRETL